MKAIKNITAFLMAVTICLSAIPISFATEENNVHDEADFQIHVSNDGDDSQDGSVLRPVKTLERARNILREHRAEDSSLQGEILVHGGVYRLSKSFSLGSSDNGITIKGYGDGEVFIRGSVKLSKTSFTKTVDEEFLKRLPQEAKGKVYQYNLGNVITGAMAKYPEYTPLHGGTGYYELFSGGMPQTPARWPNGEFSLTGNVSSDGITFGVSSDRLEKWKNADYGMVWGYFAHNWSFENVYIGDVDVDNKTVTLSRNLKQGGRVLKGKRFYVMNMPEEMDIPGEYYIDVDKKILYYYPDKHFLDEDPEFSVVTSNLFDINGGEDITISGLTFEYTRGKGVGASNSRNITVENCVLRNTGSDAVALSGMNMTVRNSEIYNTGSGGVSVTSGTNATRTCGNSVVSGNNIYNFGRVFRTYQPAVFLAGFGNRAEYNTIHDAPHCAVRFTGSEHTITHNEIYNVVLEGSDSSAIYSGRNWTCWGNVISQNYFHDITKRIDDDTFSVSAVYLDDMLTGTTVTNNFFKKCTRAVFFGGGKGNKMTDNIMVDCGEAVDYDNRAVTGEWGHGGVIAGGDPYEGFVAFLKNPDVDVEEWKNCYEGFAQLVEDVEAYQADVAVGKETVTETGFPKNSTITGNRFYGANVNNSDYAYISPYVSEYGRVENNSSSENVPELTVPEHGAEERLWSTKLYVIAPEQDAVYEHGDISFTWMRAGGAERYEVVIRDERGNEIERKETAGNGLTVKLDKKGRYTWSVTAYAYGFEETLVENGEFTIKKDSVQAGTFIAGADFDDAKSLAELRTQGWDFVTASGDSLTLEKDSDGNGYLRFERAEENFDKGSATYARFTFPEKSTGEITITYDIKIDNLRGAWRDMGSLQTATGDDIVRILNHDKYLFGVKTSGAVSERFAHDMTNLSKDSYVTMKRTINLDDNTYRMWIYQNGEQVRDSGVFPCPDGVAGSILFRLGYQSPYKPYNGTGNAIYRIDNIYVDMGETAPEITYPKNDAEGVGINERIRIKWNGNLKNFSSDAVRVFKNNSEVSADLYSVTAEGKNLYIDFVKPMEYNSDYKVILSEGIQSASPARVPMAEDYSFFFKTEVDPADTGRMTVYKTEPENGSEKNTVSEILAEFNCGIDKETVNYSTVKVYRYSVPLSEDKYSIEVLDNIIKIILDSPVKNGEGCMVKFSADIMPEDAGMNGKMHEDFVFSFDTEVKDRVTSKVVCDFEDWGDYSVKGPGTYTQNGWTFVLYEGDSVAVLKENITGSKALKLIKGETESEMKIYYDFSVSAENLIKVKFDSRVQNNSRKIHNWGTVTDSNSKTFLKLLFYGNGLWHNRIGDTSRYICGFAENSVITIESFLNARGESYTVKTYQGSSLKAEKSEGTSSKGVPQRISYSISNERDNHTGTDEGEGIYWIDNVCFEEWDVPTVENVNSDAVDTVNISFDKDLDPESVVKGNVKVYDGEMLISDYTLAVEEKNIVVKLSEKMTAGHEYRVDIFGICSEDRLTMLDNYVFSVMPKESFKVTESSAENKITAEVQSNILEYICIVADYDEAGALLGARIINCEKDEIIEVENKGNTVLYFWESLSSMKPL